jgi:Na+-translocating ferredoxin:NAD+ oxidoreductase RnfA subunit
MTFLHASSVEQEEELELIAVDVKLRLSAAVDGRQHAQFILIPLQQGLLRKSLNFIIVVDEVLQKFHLVLKTILKSRPDLLQLVLEVHKTNLLGMLKVLRKVSCYPGVECIVAALLERRTGGLHLLDEAVVEHEREGNVLLIEVKGAVDEILQTL